MLTITPTIARRLAITAQKLSGPTPNGSPQMIWETLQQIRCLQLDPIRAVERTQYLVLWSRVGQYKREDLHHLIYHERKLFEYWAHAASIVLAEDYPLHEWLMRHYGERGSSWSKRLNAWVKENEGLKQYILSEIEKQGALLTNVFEDQAQVPWSSGGWTSGRSVAYMLDYLWTKGEIMVSKRDGLKRWWDLSHRVLPTHSRTGGWTAEQVTADGLQKSLKALGLGRARDIQRHFIENRYPAADQVLPELIKQKKFIPVQVEGWSGDWYIHHDTLPLVEQLQNGGWQPRTTLLSPFDNLIRDRDRTLDMWNFYYRIEIYVPAAKRQYGYYVLPILHGDQLIGRISPRMDYKKRVLTVEAVYLEPGVPAAEPTGRAVQQTIHQLAHFLQAKEVRFEPNRPAEWQKILQDDVIWPN